MPQMDESIKVKTGDDKVKKQDKDEIVESARERLLDDIKPSPERHDSKAENKEDSVKRNAGDEKPTSKTPDEQPEQNKEKDSKATELKKERSEGQNEQRKETLKPLTPAEVEKEASVLQELANRFLSGDDPKANFDAWHAEMIRLASHGIDSVRAVFDRIKNDNAGINPFKDHVDVVPLKDGSLQIYMAPSFPNQYFLMNYRDIGAIVGRNGSVFTSADSGRFFLEHQTRYTPSSAPSSLDFSAPIYPR